MKFIVEYSGKMVTRKGVKEHLFVGETEDGIKVAMTVKSMKVWGSVFLADIDEDIVCLGDKSFENNAEQLRLL